MHLDKQTRHRLFTAGHLTKGIIYILIGAFAIATVVGAANSANGPKAVIDWLGDNPFGQFTLALVGAGLAAYALWRFYLAVADPADESEGSKKGKVKRIGWLVSGSAYAGLSVYTFQQLFSGGGSKSTKQDIIAMMLEQSWGQVVVTIIGVIVIGVGLYQGYRAATDAHMEDIKSSRLSSDQEEIVRDSGRIGLASRFVVYGVMGYFLIRTALSADADKFRGLGDALSYLENGTWGAALLAVTGTGLLAYGAFMLVKARFGVSA